MIDEIVATWWINHRINLKLIRAIDAEGMACTLSKRGGRNVVRQLTHLHYVRVLQLKKRAKALAEGVPEFDGKDEPDKKTLIAALDDSAKRVEQWLRRAAAGEPGMKTFKAGVVATLGYLVAHESHHRGSILLTLKECGHALPQDLRFAIWGAWNET